MRVVSTWGEAVEVAACVLGLVIAYFHLECDHPGCHRLDRHPSGYCRKHAGDG
jgi:hypothetical protein